MLSSLLPFRNSRIRSNAACLASLTGTVLLFAAAHPAAAQMGDVVRNYSLDVNFSDGNEANGTFTYDFTSGTASNIALMAAGGIFDNSFAYPTTITPSSIDGNYDTQQISWNMGLVFTAPFTPTSGATVITQDVSQSYLTIDQTGNGGGITTAYATSGGVSLLAAAVPEASTAASFGLLLALSGVVIAAKCKKASATQF